jgi:uncharacterized protein YndB with AHSA1/START domain
MHSPMVEIHKEIDVEATAEEVFDLIVDLRGYGRWLPHSSAYEGTAEISPGPMAAGTTYVESSSSGVRRGTIAEFERPTRVTFEQPMTLKPRLLGSIGIRVRYTLTPSAGSVHLDRLVTIEIPWHLMLIQPVIVRQFRTEIDRTLGAMKAFAEADHEPPPAG